MKVEHKQKKIQNSARIDFQSDPCILMIRSSKLRVGTLCFNTCVSTRSNTHLYPSTTATNDAGPCSGRNVDKALAKESATNSRMAEWSVVLRLAEQVAKELQGVARSCKEL